MGELAGDSGFYQGPLD